MPYSLACCSVHVEVSVEVSPNPLRFLPRVLGQDVAQQVVHSQRLARLDLDVGCLAAGAPHYLVHVDG